MSINRLHILKYTLSAKCFFCKSSSYVKPKSTHKMTLFWEKEMLHAANLKYDLLTDDEKIVHDLHNKAIEEGYFTYCDPKTTEKVLTRLRHHLRGKCCGNACRHCVYNHDNVMDESKLKVRRFNSSFWTYPEEKESEFDESCYFDGSNLRERRTRPLPSTKFDFHKG